MSKEQTIPRAISVSDLLNATFKTLPFTGEFKASFGTPEATGVWLIWGPSSNGKTSFTLQFCKYLCQFGRVAYDSLEEGVRLSMREAAKTLGLDTVKGKFTLLHREGIDTLKIRLRKHKSPDIIVVDSFQYTGINYAQYKKLKEEFPKKLFILISHADGKEPSGRAAKAVRYDADLKIFVQGYKAFPSGRIHGGSGEPFVIWEEKANEYWGE